MMKITAWNRVGPYARGTLSPQLVLRNTWTWERDSVKPSCEAIGDGGPSPLAPARLRMSVLLHGSADLLLTENESNPQRPLEHRRPGLLKDACTSASSAGHAPDRVE